MGYTKGKEKKLVGFLIRVNNTNENHMSWGYMMPFLGLGLLGLLVWAVWWVFAIAVAVFALRWLMGQMRGWMEAQSPLDIVKQRYAKGEISKEEYEEIKKELLR